MSFYRLISKEANNVYTVHTPIWTGNLDVIQHSLKHFSLFSNSFCFLFACVSCYFWSTTHDRCFVL